MTLIAAGVIAGGSLLGAGISAYGAASAAGTQAKAAGNAAQLQQNMFNTIEGQEQPFVQAGQGAQGQLNYLLGIGPQGSAGMPTSSASGGYGSLNAPFNASTFQSLSPAYQFQLQQGAQGTLNQDTSAQGGESGTALRDLTSFNQQFANTSFNNAFQQYQTQQQNTFNRLAGISQLGQAAGTNQATGASQFGQSIGNQISNVGTAQASGQVGVANAISGGINSATPWLYAGSNNLFNPSSVGGGGAATTGGGVGF